MTTFIRTRLHAPWHISHFYVANPRQHVTEHHTLCGKWVRLNQAEGATVEAEQMYEACMSCVQGHRRKERKLCQTNL